MSDSFILKFEFNDRPHILEVHTIYQPFKTVYKVLIEEHEITYEPDEEGYVRAVSNKPMHDNQSNEVDVSLLHHVATLIIQHI